MTQLQLLRLKDYLNHMIQAIEQVAQYLEDAVVRNLEVIGEAANQVVKKFPEFAASNPSVPWEAVYYMRNRVIHGYASIDYALVWQVVNKDLPPMHSALKKIQLAL